MKNKIIIIKCISNFHLFGAFSYLVSESLLNNGYLFIVIADFFSESCPYRISEDDLSFLRDENYLFFHDVDFSFSIIKSFQDLIVISPFEIPYRFIYKMKKSINMNGITCVCVDEGIGTYQSRLQWFKDSSELSNKSVLYFCLRFYLKQIPLQFFKIGSHIKKIDFYIFRRKGMTNNLIENKNVVDSYKKFFCFQKNEKFRIIYGYNNIVFFSDCISEYLIDKTNTNYVYNIIINIIKEKFPKAKLYIKPHPNELETFNFESTNCEIIKQKITTEELLNNNEIIHVFSLCSTSLLTASLFFNISSSSLIDYIPDYLISERKKHKMNTFKSNFSSIPKLSFEV